MRRVWSWNATRTTGEFDLHEAVLALQHFLESSFHSTRGNLRDPGDCLLSFQLHFRPTPILILSHTFVVIQEKLHLFVGINFLWKKQAQNNQLINRENIDKGKQNTVSNNFCIDCKCVKYNEITQIKGYWSRIALENNTLEWKWRSWESACWAGILPGRRHGKLKNCEELWPGRRRSGKCWHTSPSESNQPHRSAAALGTSFAEISDRTRQFDTPKR